MRDQPESCVRCGGSKIWVVYLAKEHGTEDWHYFGQAHFIAFQEHICAACGFVEWFASRPGNIKLSPVVVTLEDPDLRCRDCAGAEHVLVACFEEVAGPDNHPVPLAILPADRTRSVPSGTFATVICRGCGVATWFACGFSGDATLATIPRSCAACHAWPQSVVPKVAEADRHLLPVFEKGRDLLGHFRLEICHACGFVDWFAEPLSLLRTADTVLLRDGVPRRRNLS